MSGNDGAPLAGKVVVVTGGGTGIGRGIALAFAAAGADVAVAARTPGPLAGVAGEIIALGGRALAIPADLTDPGETRAMAAQVLDRFGRIDVLVNNAGGNAGPTFRQRPLLEMTAADIDETFAVNVRSMLLCSQAVVGPMNEGGGGSIVNIASRAGRETNAPSFGSGVYPAAKAAVITLTRGMAVEWAPQIRVNCVAPGTIDTPRTAARRTPEQTRNQMASIAMAWLGAPEDVAGAVLYLASGAAAWVTGTVIDVHGGFRKQ